MTANNFDKEDVVMREFVTALAIIVLIVVAGGVWYVLATYF